MMLEIIILCAAFFHIYRSDMCLSVRVVPVRISVIGLYVPRGVRLTSHPLLVPLVMKE